MSKAPPKAADAAPAADKAAKPKKKRRGLWLALLFVLLAGGGGAAWFAMSPASNAKGKPASEPARFVTLNTFTVNLQPGKSDSKYLQVAMTVKVHGEDAASAIRKQMPDIRNRLLLLLSSQRAANLLTVAGKQQLSSEILAQVRTPLPKPDQPKVAAVFFTSFVIQ